MARHPSSGGRGPRPPLGGNGGGSGRAAALGNGTAGKQRSSPALGPVLGDSRGRCEPRGGSCRAPLSRVAGALCSPPSATGKVVAFLLQASGKRRFLILVESSITPARRAAWPALLLPGIAAHRSGVIGARRVSAVPRRAERCVRSARWMRNEQVHGSIRSSCPLFRH